MIHSLFKILKDPINNYKRRLILFVLFINSIITIPMVFIFNKIKILPQELLHYKLLIYIFFLLFFFIFLFFNLIFFCSKTLIFNPVLTKKEKNIINEFIKSLSCSDYEKLCFFLQKKSHNKNHKIAFLIVKKNRLNTIDN